MGVYNKLRSKAHKKYNQAKKDYQHLENRLIQYKNQEEYFGRVNPDLVYRMRKELKDCVERLKQYKKQMSRFNREWNADYSLVNESRAINISKRRIVERYREKYGEIR